MEQRPSWSGSGEIVGYTLECNDGALGSIEGFVIEAESGAVVELVIVSALDLTNGKRFVVPLGMLQSMDRTKRVLYVGRPCADFAEEAAGG